MNLLQVEVMDPEEAAAKLIKQQAENEAKERARLAGANRGKGHAAPEPGDRLYVSTARGIKRRSRAGVTFFEERKVEVLVVADGEALDQGGEVKQVYPAGAEMILADDALNTNAPGATESEAIALRQENESLRAALATATAEAARLRDARRGAKDTGDGAPARLRAAAAAKKDTGFEG
jgi:hypothetical protein